MLPVTAQRARARTRQARGTLRGRALCVLSCRSPAQQRAPRRTDDGELRDEVDVEVEARDACREELHRAAVAPVDEVRAREALLPCAHRNAAQVPLSTLRARARAPAAVAVLSHASRPLIARSLQQPTRRCHHRRRRRALAQALRGRRRRARVAAGTAPVRRRMTGPSQHITSAGHAEAKL
eukprot:scaffold3740_cov322-Prasinococcus_capsulatus_cf.AAC.9